MRTALIVLLFVSCGCQGEILVETSESVEPVPDSCVDYCGSLDGLSGRCQKAFGEQYSVPMECEESDCPSLSEKSPELASDCSAEHLDIFCCEP